ncbi:hypothetical protein ACVIHI_001494 [Bradyrhizobium sp. USDA 4524]|nr:hypothetical protein [Bradyrhizobium sp. USDA 4538]MCP1906150.1 hypothetical protein [Bradyrhizobium sp. USDA 4537]MCP1988196.1 hypothetical protein [Bradyrhizobium sp. USDA 4539]
MPTRLGPFGSRANPVKKDALHDVIPRVSYARQPSTWGSLQVARNLKGSDVFAFRPRRWMAALTMIGIKTTFGAT